MSIPLYYGLTDDDVEDVIHAVKKVVAMLFCWVNWNKTNLPKR